MEVIDAITYKDQKIVSYLTDKEISRYFYDKDYGILLKFLRTGPKSIKEIEEAYRLEGNEKSDKTIYRYIKELSEKGLVVEAGKRIYTDDENKNKTVTIYMRTSKVFYDKTKEAKDQKENKEFKERMFKAYKILLDNLEDDKEFTVECIEDIYTNIYNEGEEYVLGLLEQADDTLFELLADMDYTEINNFVLNLTWLVMTFKKNFKRKLETC